VRGHGTMRLFGLRVKDKQRKPHKRGVQAFTIGPNPCATRRGFSPTHLTTGASNSASRQARAPKHATQTISERLCQTKNLTARHILQDEAAIFGAQGMVSEELESKLTAAEGTDLHTLLVWHMWFASEWMLSHPVQGRRTNILSEASRPCDDSEIRFPRD